MSERPACPTSDAPVLLRRCLDAQDFLAQAPKLSTAFRAFRQFAEYAFDCREDLLLWDAGLTHFGDEYYWSVALVRLFSLDDHSKQLTLELRYAPDAELEKLADVLWSEGYAARADFFAAVEQLDSFFAAGQLDPTAYELELERF